MPAFPHHAKKSKTGLRRHHSSVHSCKDSKESYLADDGDDHRITFQDPAEKAPQRGPDAFLQTGELAGADGFDLVQHQAFGIFQHMAMYNDEET